MFECKYCASVFERLAEGGNCPKCGGPGPKQIQPEVVEVVVKEYVYVQPPSTSSYYVPTRLNPVQSTYSKLGYQLATTLFVIGLIVLIVIAVYVFTYRSPIRQTGEYSLPTAAPSPTAVPETNPWRNELWLSPEEARELRDEANVVNLAYLERGNASYSAEHSFAFSEADPWKEVTSLGITEITVNGTSVLIEAYGYEYNLNVYQPFVVAQQSDKVFVINTKRVVWAADLTNLAIVSNDEAEEELPFSIEPNQNLSFTH
ncbi:hypothetical protein A2962_03115 [Candidatus Woesebacteria bacterium RIFCSPLOWO2_01_FULL_39_61]|uniref:Uncharacterized protein n=1 Tax=Candidatus Woesebacteria bacterium RIFCSPHIGHO2_02_FULL_39_13 TaxID=1802505 RepID=A0A1F7Z057_9BACT|nr:MAG: hypothetical protein A2692_05910 [Candidatus Woesebacteria bacterium RIFCSPHIGHO2_01_FULL_39_95]OGM32972.1 MAG: hypothetical protein A3D01_05610 [Candidatus Woesebacteria bacterium RIFCSPHIGHO2_02_FULL_39_13]OGM36934.1 MAG: hypothetical protein A3E13_01425 [Candidatus Woesebacteria bacterium RIFCSPHIGHO2_12_FULL_40_20]OGM66409.1 MAG: hypothetical protein A2962_03115 [Candidatus Woesebacteria bacterium RIFCSPLOWO2_01_FULL_39_61]OGM73936.1 MAG: hypothetical protein A3H19_02680 [Candidatus